MNVWTSFLCSIFMYIYIIHTIAWLPIDHIRNINSYRVESQFIKVIINNGFPNRIHKQLTTPNTAYYNNNKCACNLMNLFESYYVNHRTHVFSVWLYEICIKVIQLWINISIAPLWWTVLSIGFIDFIWSACFFMY